MNALKSWAAAAAMLALACAAQATPVFQGRLADGTASSTCTVSGAAKCTSFYDSNLNITILNNWNIGIGDWDESANPRAGSAQALAEAAGLAATGLTGWVLPTEDPVYLHQDNQVSSIWSDVGASIAGLQGQFDGVQPYGFYWSGTADAATGGHSTIWIFDTAYGVQTRDTSINLHGVVAVRPGDVAATVPEPQTLALVLLALTGTLVANRRRPR